MFLHTFSGSEKKAFWTLANAVIMADSVLANEEDTLLSEYVREMGIERAILDQEQQDTSSAICVLSSSTRVVQLSAYTELYALALCDHKYVMEEKSLMVSLGTALSISAEKAAEIESCIKALNDVYDRLGNAIHEG